MGSALSRGFFELVIALRLVNGMSRRSIRLVCVVGLVLSCFHVNAASVLICLSAKPASRAKPINKPPTILHSAAAKRGFGRRRRRPRAKS